MNERKKILITGGSGYVGGRLIRALIKLDQYLVYVASRKDSIDNVENEDNSVHYLNSERIFSSDYAFEVIFDTVIHLAAFNEIDSVRKPIEAAEFNIISSLKLLQKAIQAKCRKFIYFSTAHVYGAPLVGIIDETTLPRPVHPYSISHKAFEDYVLAARDQGQIDGIVLRMSNSFGAPINKNVDRWSLLINDLCRQAVTQDRLEIKSSGTQERDFITLTDVEKAVLFFINKNSRETNDGLFNLGGNNTQSIIDVAKIIAERSERLFEKKLKIVVNTGGEINSNESKSPLNFISAKLKNIGFVWENNFIEELDGLLLFCNKEFNNDESFS